MDQRETTMGLTVYSIGHSNHSFPVFLDLLKQSSIEVLVDVRSHPYSKYAPEFGSGKIEKLLMHNEIKYLFMGTVLGGRPTEDEFYDEEGYVLYTRLAASIAFQKGISRLERGIRQYLVAIMCSEEDPKECHRRLLIGRVLAKKGITVLHMRGSGVLQTEEELTTEERSSQPEVTQLGLFGAQEANGWKSTLGFRRSGLPLPPVGTTRCNFRACL